MKHSKKLLALFASLAVGQLVEAKSDSAIYKVATKDLAQAISDISSAGFAVEIQALEEGAVLVKIKEGSSLIDFLESGEYFGDANVESQQLAGRCPPGSAIY